MSIKMRDIDNLPSPRRTKETVQYLKWLQENVKYSLISSSISQR